MEIIILEKVNNMVYVQSDFGLFYGVWCSEDPQKNKKYHVELDIDQSLTCDDIEMLNFSVPHIEYVEGKASIFGLIEEVEDNIIFLRLNKSIIMFQVSSQVTPKNYLGHYVRLEVKEIKLFDIGI